MTLVDERSVVAADVSDEPAASPRPEPAENAPTAPAGGHVDRAAKEKRLGWLWRGRKGRVKPAAPMQQVAEPARGDDREAEKLVMLHRARKSAVAVTVFIAGGSFALSFYSLWDMASQLAWPGYIAWLWPLIVDGMIIVATMALVAFGGYAGQKTNVIYSWCVLAFGAVVSMAANFVHPLLPHLMGQSQGPITAGMWLGAGMSCIPPIALLACTHLLARLWAFSPEGANVAAAATETVVAVVADSAGGAAELSRAVAGRIQASGKLSSYPEDDVAEMIRLLFQTEPPLKLREIGRMVDRHHDVVGRVRDEVSALLGVGIAGDAAG